MVLAAWAAIAFFGSLLASWAGARVALQPLRAARPATWTERARLGFPGRAVSRIGLLLLPTAFAIAAWREPVESTLEPPVLVALAVAIPALVGAFLTRLSVERAVRGQPVAAGTMLRGWVALWAVLFPHVLAGGVGLMLASDRFDGRTFAVLGAVMMAVGATFAGGGVAIARGLGVARPASERLRRAVDAASAATGIHPRRVMELDLAMANAFALPGARLLLFTPDAQRALSDAQLAAVARHELGHVGEPGRVVAARVTGAMVVVGAIVALRPVIGELREDVAPGWLLVQLLVILAALLFVLLALRPLARRMEERADAIAQAHDTRDGEYAHALEALYAHNLAPAVANTRTTHPHLYDRLVAAGVTPAWPRPVPPSRGRLRAALATCMGIAVLALASAMVAGTP